MKASATLLLTCSNARGHPADLLTPRRWEGSGAVVPDVEVPAVLPAHPQDWRNDDEGREHAVLSTWLKVQQSLLKAVKPRKGW